MIELKIRTAELEAELLYSVMDPPMVGSSHTNLDSNRQFSQEGEPQAQSRITTVGLVPHKLSTRRTELWSMLQSRVATASVVLSNMGGSQEIPYPNLHLMKREELLLMRMQLLQSLKSDKQLSSAREKRTKSNLSPLVMSRTEEGRGVRMLLSTTLRILGAWASLG